MEADRYTVIFAFAYSERVMVSGTGAEGIVTSRSDTDGKIEYRVLTYLNGQRSESWYYEHELERK